MLVAGLATPVRAGITWAGDKAAVADCAGRSSGAVCAVGAACSAAGRAAGRGATVFRAAALISAIDLVNDWRETGGSACFGGSSAAAGADASESMETGSSSAGADSSSLGAAVSAGTSPPRKYARTFSAASSSSELECDFFSVMPTFGRLSRIVRLFTSSSLASSLIRILPISPLSEKLYAVTPEERATRSVTDHNVNLFRRLRTFPRLFLPRQTHRTPAFLLRPFRGWPQTRPFPQHPRR